MTFHYISGMTVSRVFVYSLIELEVIQRAKSLVINQSRFQIWWENYDNGDGMYEYAEGMTDDATEKLLQGKSIIDTDNLYLLAIDIGVTNLFRKDSWIDEVAEYIHKHQEDCKELWDHIHHNADR